MSRVRWRDIRAEVLASVGPATLPTLRGYLRKSLDAAKSREYVGIYGYRRVVVKRSLLSSSGSIHVLDLFSGAGGLTEGFRQASDRFETIRAVESDLAAAASYAANHGDDAIFAGRIEDWLTSEDVPRADVVVGGPPCQGFSALGKQDVHDERSQLWLRYADVIRQAAPRYFVLENVPAFLSSEQYKRLQRQCQPSNRLGNYSFRATILNSADFGAAQVRKRVIVLGHHRDLPFPGFPPATHTRANWRPIKEALAGLSESVRETDLPERWTEYEGRRFRGAFDTDELHVTRHYESRSLERFAHIPSGGNRFDIPDDLLSPCWRKHTTGSADVMGRLRWDEPSVTIRTEFFKPEKGRYLHPTEQRALTHHEGARIQGFSDDYKWVGSKTAIARQIGNAVPIPLGRAVARQLLVQF